MWLAFPKINNDDVNRDNVNRDRPSRVIITRRLERRKTKSPLSCKTRLGAHGRKKQESSEVNSFNQIAKGIL